MEDIGSILDNRVLLVAGLACLAAQILKVVIEFARYGKVNLRVLVETGGMPSSHSAVVTALSFGVGQSLGWSSPFFAATAIFAIIVMYDAAGVRQAAGKQARILNQMIDELFREHPDFYEVRLIDLLGHTPVQVIAGSALGAAIACLTAPAY